MTFKDACNAKCDQTAESGNVVHLSNLCTEITEVTSDDQTAMAPARLDYAFGPDRSR